MYAEQQGRNESAGFLPGLAVTDYSQTAFSQFWLTVQFAKQLNTARAWLDWTALQRTQ